MANDSNDQIKEFFQKEIEKSETAVRWTWIIGLPLVLIMFGYLGWINIQLNRLVLNSDNLAHVAAVKLDSGLPEMVDQLERRLASQAPEIAGTLFQQLMGMVDIVEASGKENIDTVVQLLPVLDVHTKQAVDTYFALHGPQVKQFFDQHQDEKFVEHFVNALLLGLAEKFAEDYQVQRVENGRMLTTLTEVSLANLRDLNHDLASMIKKRPMHMTPRERLQRRLIVAWVNALGKELDLGFSTSTAAAGG